jgi:hypothetical protein
MGFSLQYIHIPLSSACVAGRRLPILAGRGGGERFSYRYVEWAFSLLPLSVCCTFKQHYSVTFVALPFKAARALVLQKY